MPSKVTETIIVNREAKDIYKLWANFENFPHFMKYIKSVTKLGNRASHWTIEGPLGVLVTWDVEMTTLEENKRIAWSSKDKTDNVKTSGQVTFNSLPHSQTEVTVTLQYVPPGGKAGEVINYLFSDPTKRLQEDLRNFKAYAEGMVERIS